MKLETQNSPKSDGGAKGKVVQNAKGTEHQAVEHHHSDQTSSR